jgi:hypothetical protein
VENTIDGVASNSGVGDPILQRTDDVKYATWQPECQAVMLEIVPTKIHEKVAAAEAAMAKRRVSTTLRQVSTKFSEFFI